MAYKVTHDSAGIRYISADDGKPILTTWLEGTEFKLMALGVPKLRGLIFITDTGMSVVAPKLWGVQEPAVLEIEFKKALLAALNGAPEIGG